jgi:hypothetical protein
MNFLLERFNRLVSVMGNQSVFYAIINESVNTVKVRWKRYKIMNENGTVM